MYQVIGATKSRTLRVLWMLEELGVAYAHSPALPGSEEVRAVNPSGKIPVLIAEGTVVTDSLAILTYLADKHERFTYPPGTLHRARQDSFTNAIIDEFDAILWTAARHSFVLPQGQRVPEIKDSLRWEFTHAAERMAARLADGPYLMGETMTLADILLTHCLGWAIVARFPVDPPQLRAYFDTMKARPAYRRALEV